MEAIQNYDTPNRNIGKNRQLGTVYHYYLGLVTLVWVTLVHIVIVPPEPPQ